MKARSVAAASLLVVFAFPGISGDSNITLLTLPVNLTSWRISINDAFNRSLVAARLNSAFNSALNDTVGFLKNGSIGCTPQGEECFPDVPSCCPSTTSGHYGSAEDEDLQCLPYGDGVHRCGLVTDPEDIAQLRLNALQYGDSAGVLESHPWVNSWEFQSKSEAEREELQALEEADWKKHWKPSSQENFWLKSYKKIKKEAMDVWKDLRKMKKLKEVKDFLTDRKNKRLEPTIPPAPVEQENPAPATPKAARVLYPDELSEETNAEGQPKKDSEESVIKFSDELPKRDKVDFSLKELIKNAIDVASKKITNKKQGSQPAEEESHPVIPSLSSEEELLRLDQIQGTVDKLMKELGKLKELKTQQKEIGDIKESILNMEDKLNGPNIDELIKKHVHNILEEKRKLYESMKIEEAERLKKKGSLKT